MTISNTIRIVVDKNPDYNFSVVNTDLLREIAARAFDWRLFEYDGDNYHQESAEAIFAKLDAQRKEIADACGVVDSDFVDAYDFVWAINDPTQTIALISYEVNPDSFVHD